MNNIEDQKITLHIHEHLGPFRDRLSKVEERVETHSASLQDLSHRIKDLDDKVEENHSETLKSITQIKEDVIKAFQEHDTKDQVAFQSMNDKLDLAIREFSRLRWTLAGIVATVSLIGAVVLNIMAFWNPFK
jgi:predicted  nucleic acid-binding Zn-ribbon protein